jgi:N-acetylneuraminate synthase
MSSINDIKNCLKIFKKYKCKFTLMHCISTYPAEEKSLNLNMIKELKKIFKCDVGYSGHEKTVSPSITAFMLGATVIERHITLDRSMWGTDQSASLSETGLHSLTTILHKIPLILGDGKKRISSEEKIMLKKFKYW